MHESQSQQQEGGLKKLSRSSLTKRNEQKKATVPESRARAGNVVGTFLMFYHGVQISNEEIPDLLRFRFKRRRVFKAKRQFMI